MADRRYPTEADKVELADLYHTARIAGKVPKGEVPKYTPTPLSQGDIDMGWQKTNRGRMIYKSDLPVENAKEEFVANAIENTPSYQNLLSAYKRFKKRLHSPSDPYVAKGIAEVETQPWQLLTAHSGVMNAKSSTAQTLRRLADNVFKEAKLPRKPQGKFRGEDALDWDKVVIPLPGQAPLAKAGKEVKQPWEMTAEEFLDYQANYLMGRYRKASPQSVEKVATLIEAEKIQKRDPASLAWQLNENRKYQVAAALSEGKPVPPEVLADYPDLAAKAKPLAQEAKPPAAVVPTPEEIQWRFPTADDFYFWARKNKINEEQIRELWSKARQAKIKLQGKKPPVSESATAKANFEKKWQQAYGNRPETEVVETALSKRQRELANAPAPPELTMEEARKVAKMTPTELAAYNAKVVMAKVVNKPDPYREVRITQKSENHDIVVRGLNTKTGKWDKLITHNDMDFVKNWVDSQGYKVAETLPTTESTSATDSGPTPKLGESISKATGMKFEGLQEVPGGRPSLMVFTDPQTRSTLFAPDLETAQTRLAAMRAKFAPELTADKPPFQATISPHQGSERWGVDYTVTSDGKTTVRRNYFDTKEQAEAGRDYFKEHGYFWRPEPKTRLSVRPSTYRNKEGFTVSGIVQDIGHKVFFEKRSEADEYKRKLLVGEDGDAYLKSIWGITESGSKQQNLQDGTPVVAVGDEIRSELDPRIRGEVANLTELFGGPAYKVKLADGSTMIVPKTDAVLLRTVKERKEGMQAMARPAEKSQGLQPGMLVRDKRLGTISHLVKELPNTQWEVRNIPGGELQRGGPSTFYIDAGAIEVLDKIPDIPDLDFALSKFGVKAGDTVSVSDSYSKATHRGILQPDGRIVGDGPDFSPNWLRLRPGDLVVQKVNAVNVDKALPSKPSKEGATVEGMEAPKALQQFDKLLTQWLKAKLGSEKDAIRGKMEELLPRLSVADIDNLLAALPPGKFVLGGGLSEQDYREELLKETRRKVAARAESTQEWTPFEPQGKATHKDNKGYTFKDPKWGYTDKAALEQSLIELKSHIGEKVWVSGGGGPGGYLATLRGGHIEGWNVKDGEEKRWGIRADLLADETIMGSKEWDPWLDSWRISFKTSPNKPVETVKQQAIASRHARVSERYQKTGQIKDAAEIAKLNDAYIAEGLQSIEQSRSPLSRSLDESQSNAVTIDPDDPRTKIWKRDPGRMDVRGIDTPKPRAKSGARSKKASRYSHRKVGKTEAELLRIK